MAVVDDFGAKGDEVDAKAENVFGFLPGTGGADSGLGSDLVIGFPSVDGFISFSLSESAGRVLGMALSFFGGLYHQPFPWHLQRPAKWGYTPKASPSSA